MGGARGRHGVVSCGPVVSTRLDASSCLLVKEEILGFKAVLKIWLERYDGVGIRVQHITQLKDEKTQLLMSDIFLDKSGPVYVLDDHKRASYE